MVLRDLSIRLSERMLHLCQHAFSWSAWRISCHTASGYVRNGVVYATEALSTKVVGNRAIVQATVRTAYF